MESRKTLAALLLAAAALQPSPAVRGDSACGGNAADTSPVRVLVAPTSRRVPFYVEHNGSVISCDDVCKERPHGVRFGDIAGMDNLKKDLFFLVDVLKNPKKYEGRMRPVKGVILEGPPGNGKTYFAKALASEADVNFIATKGADFQSALMSMSARKLKMLFNKARRHRPCIVFIDEFDSIGERRNYAGTGIDKENNRLITTMLNEMDGFMPFGGMLVIAATNSYASLDPALIRPGRFDLKYTIGNPDPKTRAELVAMYTKGKTLSAELSTEALVSAFDGASCAAIEAVLNEAQAICQMTGKTEINAEILSDASHKTGVKLNIKTRK